MGKLHIVTDIKHWVYRTNRSVTMNTSGLFRLTSGVKGVQGVRHLSLTPQHQATLKDVRIKLKSVTNIQKITKTMQMVSASKYARAERELKPARVYGTGAQKVFDAAELTADESKPNHLIIAISSDRGLCGGIHSGVAKGIKAYTAEHDVNTKVVICGDKAKAALQRTHPGNILCAFAELGRKPPLFEEASFIAEQVQDTGYEFDVCKMFYNKFSLANLVFYGMKESACSEQSARMTAMDNATKNAGDMIQALQIVYNRTRQAVITTELIEIISGCVALETAD